ncbi:MAG: hypothetical protein K6F14_06295 [Clostridiales bacterium]|nr:hypothetical protein [Clostridiales bacterium]
MDRECIRYYGNKSLYSIFKSIKDNEWKYYRSAYVDDIITCFDDTTNCDNSNSKKMIIEYINAGGKVGVFNPIIDDIKKIGIDYKLPISNMRCAHSLSVFLLGIVIYKVLKRKKRILNWYGDNYNSGLYVWYLTCLFHDIGYYYENNEIELDKSIINGCKHLNNYDLGLNYYNYRKNVASDYNGIDHGVCGGFLLFNELNNIFHNHNDNEELCYDDDVKKLYKIAAEAIVRHNMYVPNTDSQKNQYRELGLNDLIDSKIQYNMNNPFAFLLCLCDTLEPIKKASFFNLKYNYSFAEVLKKVKICMCDYPHCLDTNFCIKYSVPFQSIGDLYNSIGVDELEKWLGVKVSHNTDCDLSLKISF